jgi:2-polyprenyl-3-methyl-5-hydroxy-6-metoxy-1,4-benzoquinol methylase
MWDLGVLDGRRFDAIYTHSLEHVPDVPVTVRRCHDLLRDDGILMVEAPNQFEALKERFKEALWRPLGKRLVPHLKSDAPPVAHISYFSPRTLRRTLEQGGFEILESRTYLPWNPIYHAERRGRMIREFVYFVGGLVGMGPSIEVIGRRLPSAASTTGATS